ncbi:MAG: LemA family protein [Gammaproteobacteria bacterium]|nr:LemA family protein [Gammaproteobacteria bacterium]
MGTGSTLLIILAVLAVYIISIYNQLVAGKNEFKNAFSQIDVQLQRRYDLIPNLVETARAYMQHEQETLSRVIAARNEASVKAGAAAENPDNASLVGALARAESNLGRELGKFSVVVENYPELKADQNMRDLSDELVTTDNRVSFARQAYSDSVMRYNTLREEFPSNLIAGLFNFRPADLFEIRDPDIGEPMRISLA